MESGGVVCSVPADPTSSNSESPVKVQTVAEEEESSSSSQPLGEDSEKEAADKTSEQTRRESENEEVVVLDHPNNDDDSDNKAENEEAVEEESKENGIASKDGEDEVVLELDPIALVAVEVQDDEEDVDKEANPISPPPPTQPSKTVEGRAKSPEEEMQQSSTCSSPSSTLHIHLDEEDKDESVNDKDKDIKETTDPSLPLISNVVSLSTVGQSGAEDTKPVTSPSSSPTPSGGEGNNSNSSATPRRTTLRLKRGIEISFDVDQNGQPVTVNNNNHSSGSSALPSGSSGEPRQKRGRLDDEDEEDLSELDVEGTNGILASVQKDIRTLRFMAKQKEKEWNYILKLMKVKEELQAKLMRRREVLKITTSSLSAALSSNSMLLGGGRNKHLPSSSQPQVAAQQILHGHQTSQASIQSFINQSLHAIKSSGKNSGLGSSGSSFSGSHGQQQQQHHQSSTNKMLQQNRQRPILPKPSMQVHQSEVQQMWGHHHSSNHHASHHQNLLDATLNLDDHHHRQQQAQQNQGTINVQSLIADYRAKHPEEIPTRGRRIRQPSRICNDPNSSSSPPPSQNSGADAAGVSFKDVLLQFAKMSSRQGLTNAVDMSQLGKEALGNSVSGMSGGSGNSSAAALQNLAAARNARGTSSPGQHHTPGSILQSALSGGSRTNPTFAPTLAQLLTNPAGDSQQLSSNHSVASLPASAAAVNSASSSSVAAAAAAASAAEVLTLSNLLATAKGHVTITSDRDHNNDDITVVGGTTSVRSGGPSNNANNGNYLRTSGGSEVPKCQGCSERVAQFVCAGCSSQWYCSRECQVAAWEEHSEHCVG